MTTTDQLRAALRDLEAKAREAELDKKIETFADQADRFLRTAASRAGELAAENRDRIDAKLTQAGASVDSRTEGKYHSWVDKVRSGVLTGVDWVAEQQRESATASATPASAPAEPATAEPATATPGTPTPAPASPATATPAPASPATASPATSAGPTAAATGTPSTAGDLGDEGITSEGAWAATTDTATDTDPVTEEPREPQAPPER